MRKPNAFLVVAFLVLALTLATAAGAAAATAATPRSGFIAKADAICTAAAKRVDAFLDAYPADDPTAASTPDATVKAFAPVLSQVIATTRGEIRSLRGLRAPKAIRADWAAALAAYARATDILARAIPAARQANRARMTKALQDSAPFSRRASVIAQRLGFQACGNV